MTAKRGTDSDRFRKNLSGEFSFKVMAGDDEVVILCRPVGQEGGSFDFQSSGLRCRLMANGSAVAEMPALPDEDASAVHCCCSSEALHQQTQVSIVLPGGGELRCEAVKQPAHEKAVAVGLFKKLYLLDRYLFCKTACT